MEAIDPKDEATLKTWACFLSHKHLDKLDLMAALRKAFLLGQANRAVRTVTVEVEVEKIKFVRPDFGTVPATLDALEREMINNAIEACRGDTYEAAKMLGIGKTTIYRRLRQWEQAESRGVTQ